MHWAPRLTVDTQHLALSTQHSALSAQDSAPYLPIRTLTFVAPISFPWAKS